MILQQGKIFYSRHQKSAPSLRVGLTARKFISDQFGISGSRLYELEGVNMILQRELNERENNAPQMGSIVLFYRGAPCKKETMVPPTQRRRCQTDQRCTRGWWRNRRRRS
jgi:hypothetical protein